MPVRMVACDLDGTVVRSDGTVSERTLAAFDACERLGVDVVFVTGRPPRWLPPIAEVTGHHGLAVCGNGAAVVDLTTFEVVRVSDLPPAAVLEVAERLRARVDEAVFALETLDGVRREPGFMPRHAQALAALTGTLPELLDGSPAVIKLLCRQDPLPRERRLSADALLRIARVELAGIAEPVHSDPFGGMLEISAPGVSKASGLAGLATERGIAAADVVAFGDMPNDVPMLRWAGRGFAMSGGHPAALEAAGEVAPPCEEDGVARVVETLLASFS
jgi:HAD superfamily hydrolase (TIGR01484 family)